MKKSKKVKKTIYLIEIYHGQKVSEHAFVDCLSAWLFYEKVNFTCQVLGDHDYLFITTPREKVIVDENY